MNKYLDLFSKPRGVGDHTSGGRNKLLNATSNITKAELLIRETIQNSWDAALDGWNPSYEIRVCRLSENVLDALCNRVFYEIDSSISILDEVLHGSDVFAIEIADRGTVGLNGPIRAEQVPLDPTKANFSALVFEIGTAKENVDTGGTYGFGKTVAFDFSAVHTLIYWTATINEAGKYEFRFIASALHDEFSRNNKRFTGAHWWGNIADRTIEPVVGANAQELGDTVFSFPFDYTNEETGTSILIIDPTVEEIERAPEGEISSRSPVRTMPQAKTLVAQLQKAIIDFAWPKFISYNEGSLPLEIQLSLEGEQVDLMQKVQKEYLIRSYALQTLRATQLNDTYNGRKPRNLLNDTTIIPITLRPPSTLAATNKDIFGDKTDNTIGHISICHFVETESEGAEARPNTICFMRSKAELPAWYEEVNVDNEAMVKWVAVFKPTPECDKHFASCEPPTHDAWMPNIAESPASKYVVEKTLINVRRKLRDHLAKLNPERGVTSTMSTKQVAKSLSRYAPTRHASVAETGHKPPPPRGTRRRKKMRPIDSVEIVKSQMITSSDFSTVTQHVELMLPDDATSHVTINVDLTSVTPDGSAPVIASTAVDWLSIDGRQLDPPVKLAPGDSVRIRIVTEGLAQLELKFFEDKNGS